MSKSEDYLDDLLNSVSDANRRNNSAKDENLLQAEDMSKAKSTLIPHNKTYTKYLFIVSEQ